MDVIERAAKMADEIRKMVSETERLKNSKDVVSSGKFGIKAEETEYWHYLEDLMIDEDKVKNFMESMINERLQSIEKELAEYIGQNNNRGIPSKGNISANEVDKKEVKKSTSNKPKQSRIGHARVDDLNVDEVREFYYREGETQKTTAKHFNVGQNAIAQFMKDNGINSKPGGNQKLATQMAAEKKRKETAKKMEDATKHLDENEVFNLIAKQGMTYKEVADHFGIDKKMLHRYCEEHNIYNPSYIRK